MCSTQGVCASPQAMAKHAAEGTRQLFNQTRIDFPRDMAWVSQLLDLYLSPISAGPTRRFSDGGFHGNFSWTSLLTMPKSISPASGCFFSAPITLPISFFDWAPVSWMARSTSS